MCHDGSPVPADVRCRIHGRTTLSFNHQMILPLRARTTTFVVVATCGLAMASACGDDFVGPSDGNAVVLANSSSTVPLVKNVMSGVSVYSLLSSDDILSGSPSYVFGGSTDGSALIRNSDQTFTLVVSRGWRSRGDISRCRT